MFVERFKSLAKKIVAGKESRRLISKAGPDKNDSSSMAGQRAASLKNDDNLAAEKFRKELLKRQSPAEAVRAPSEDDLTWLSILAGSDNDLWEAGALKDAQRLCYSLACNLFELISSYAEEFNSAVDKQHLQVTMTPPSTVTEKLRVLSQIPTIEKTETVTYLRWRASTSSWSLSCRSKDELVEVFLVPASDTIAFSQAEAPFRLRLKLQLLQRNNSFVWTMERLPAGADDLRVLSRQAFRDLILNSQDSERPFFENSVSSNSSPSEARIDRSISQLLLERQNLAQKVVSQQEEIQRRIARDLHDAVISDVMSLKRSLNSERPPADEEVALTLEKIVMHLREICYDLSPRDLGDWGLATVIEDMLELVAQRSGTDCVLNCDIEIPVLPTAVQLHIYRIVQESLNNIEKYAQASRVVISIEQDGGSLRFLIADDGQGFDPQDAQSEDRTGGYGLGSIKERAALIRSFYPAKLSIDSAEGKGTRTLLELDLGGRG